MARKKSSSSPLDYRSRCKRQNKETDKMTDLGRISLMNLPDETIEEVASFLSFEELIKLTKLGSKRLEECAKRTLKKKSCKLVLSIYGIIETSILYNINIQFNQIIRILFTKTLFRYCNHWWI